MSFGKEKRYKKEPEIQEKVALTQTLVSRTKTESLYVESEPQIDTNKYLDNIITSNKYIVWNLMEMSDSNITDIWYPLACNGTIDWGYFKDNRRKNALAHGMNIRSSMQNYHH